MFVLIRLLFLVFLSLVTVRGLATPDQNEGFKSRQITIQNGLSLFISQGIYRGGLMPSPNLSFLPVQAQPVISLGAIRSEQPGQQEANSVDLSDTVNRLCPRSSEQATEMGALPEDWEIAQGSEHSLFFYRTDGSTSPSRYIRLELIGNPGEISGFVLNQELLNYVDRRTDQLPALSALNALVQPQVLEVLTRFQQSDFSDFSGSDGNNETVAIELPRSLSTTSVATYSRTTASGVDHIGASVEESETGVNIVLTNVNNAVDQQSTVRARMTLEAPAPALAAPASQTMTRGDQNDTEIDSLGDIFTRCCTDLSRYFGGRCGFRSGPQ